ncbi:DNA repair protein RecN [Algimonas porphyrae]|uniref:DNA repair protein RecN n=1 Tax=Algimonas porphyrae TaxID=1128113 RepID=A0ABQ5UYD2_9PROT|nr:DNA repair protein RecN [Algimonas porphyrae]GLQ20221.1 DNA repair protein RecN [Algimonas porphyrae]
MLNGLSVRNVVLIESLDLTFEAGLTALTGETGAGKSILLDALGMAAGARSDRGLVRAGTDKASTTASFTLSADHPVWGLLSDNDIDGDAAEDLRLKRVVSADGRSRAYVNDQLVGVKVLSRIGLLLLEVHGQHDGRGLLDPQTHMGLLDMFGGYDDVLLTVWSAFQDRRDTQTKLDTLLARQAKAGDDRDFLVAAMAELDRLDPRADEEDALVEQRRFLQGAEGALTELTAAQDTLGEGGEFEQRLTRALSGIERVRAKFGDGEGRAATTLQAAADGLERALLETNEARAAVGHAAETFDVEPGKLEQVEERLFALRAASRKYGVPIGQLIGKRAAFAQELSDIETVDADIQAVKAARDAAKQRYDQAAGTLTAARQKAAHLLDKAVATELPPLKMDRARFVTDIAPASETAAGMDQVRFTVSTNPGTPLGPLDRIASGGEMARFALAIKVALAARTQSVMVFDEVDQGVGGAVAAAVGRRLAKLSETAQVFVVTHSPQVAAAADHQFRIEKTSADATTTTQVHAISESEREEEIARMLAGATITDAARAAARQLMDPTA